MEGRWCEECGGRGGSNNERWDIKYFFLVFLISEVCCAGFKISFSHHNSLSSSLTVPGQARVYFNKFIAYTVKPV